MHQVWTVLDVHFHLNKYVVKNEQKNKWLTSAQVSTHSSLSSFLVIVPRRALHSYVRQISSGSGVFLGKGGYTLPSSSTHEHCVMWTHFVPSHLYSPSHSQQNSLSTHSMALDFRPGQTCFRQWSLKWPSLETSSQTNLAPWWPMEMHSGKQNMQVWASESVSQWVNEWASERVRVSHWVSEWERVSKWVSEWRNLWM